MQFSPDLIERTNGALRFFAVYPSVEVDQKLADEMTVIDIRDHRPGVPEKDLPHVFERLYRGAVPEMAEPNASGLGLPLAKSIVEGHGGAISLSNAEGGEPSPGCRCRFLIQTCWRLLHHENSIGRR